MREVVFSAEPIVRPSTLKVLYEPLYFFEPPTDRPLLHMFLPRKPFDFTDRHIEVLDHGISASFFVSIDEGAIVPEGTLLTTLEPRPQLVTQRA